MNISDRERQILHTSTYMSQEAMAPHSSTLAWEIPWAEEPGRLQSMGSLRVRHDWTTSLSLFTFIHWRRKWQPTPVFLPGESQGWGSLVGCRLWGHTESDTTDAMQQQQQQQQQHVYMDSKGAKWNHWPPTKVIEKRDQTHDYQRQGWLGRAGSGGRWAEVQTSCFKVNKS